MKAGLIKGSRIGWRGALVFPSDYFDTEPPVAGGLLKYWTGSAWAAKTLKAWNGSAWQAGLLKFWNGASWQLSND